MEGLGVGDTGETHKRSIEKGRFINADLKRVFFFKKGIGYIHLHE